MPKVTGTVVGFDDFLPPDADFDKHEFHIVIEEERTGRRMRLRANSHISLPLRLEHFGAGANCDEIRERFVLGARLVLDMIPVWQRHYSDPNFHEMDVVVPHPGRIERDYRASLTRGVVLQFPGMLRAARA